MNTDPTAKVVLCYGDSNTWGQRPDKTGRFPANVRWTGQLQKLLGCTYSIIEEGLGGRTVNLEYDKKPGRKGSTYLQPCLESHNPLDVVLIMLGTNDLKKIYERTVDDIAQSLKELVELVRRYSKDKDGKTPKILLISPILIDDTAPRFTEFYKDYYDNTSAQESQKLALAIKRLADEQDCNFVDASSVAKSGEDGIHFSEESHAGLAKLLAQELKQNE